MLLRNSCRIVTPVALLLAALVLPGCSRDEFNELVDKAKTATTESAEKMQQAVTDTRDAMESASAGVQEELQLAGSIELSAGVAIQTNACYVHFVPQGSGRAAVFQLRSYRDAGSESFPSVFLQAQTRANSIEELAAEGTIPSRLFVQLESNGPVLFSDVGQPVELTITNVDDETLAAELSGGSLRSTESAPQVTVTGTFQGVRKK